MRENEKLQSAEILRRNGPENGRGETSLTAADVEKVFRERTEMFVSIERYVKVSLREALREKIEKEKKLLLELLEGQKRAAEMRERTLQMLNPAYFTQKSLNISMFD